MITLNFSHPLTAEQLAQVTGLTKQPVERVVDVPVQVDHGRPLAEQIAKLAEAAGLSSEEWQTLPLVVNPPGYAPAATALLAELHGRMGHFPPLLWIRAAAGSTPTRFEVSEIVDVQTIRDRAREGRRPHFMDGRTS